MIKIVILGSTGSIGTQALDVIREHAEDFYLLGLSGYSDDTLLLEQNREFNPQFIGFPKKIADNCIYGPDYLLEIIDSTDADIYLNAVSGIYGLRASLAVLEKGADLALANKESVVSFGSLLTDMAQKSGSQIYPVDSEHSAIWQSLRGEERHTLEKIYLTASGGPFRTYSYEMLERVTVEEAVRHPNWSMGRKISVDSATMMNKGLEMIEAAVLFDLSPDQITVLVHPQSIVHSMVQYIDGSVIAQLGTTDMRQAIQYALYGGKRVFSARSRLDPVGVGNLEFFHPDEVLFPALSLAREALKLGNGAPVILNTANNIAVERFLRREISFPEITAFTARMMDKIQFRKISSVKDVLELQNEVIRHSERV